MPNRQAFVRGGGVPALSTGWVWAVKPFAALFALSHESNFQRARPPSSDVALNVSAKHQFVRPQWGIL
jgi:hypothetical protein